MHRIREKIFWLDSSRSITKDIKIYRVYHAVVPQKVLNPLSYTGTVRYLNQHEKKEICAQGECSLMARVHVALQYLQKRHYDTYRLALSVERLLRVTGQFCRSSLQLHDRKKKTRRLQLVKQRRHERAAINACTVFSSSFFKIITSS